MRKSNCLRIAKKILDKNNDEMIRRFYRIDTKAHYRVTIIKTGWVLHGKTWFSSHLPLPSQDFGL